MYFLEGQLQTFKEKLKNSHIAPMKTYPALVEIRSCLNNDQQEKDKLNDLNGTPRYWSWTFGFTTVPFVFWGCPFYLLTGTPFQITNTGTWFKRIFDFCSFPVTTVFSILLLIPTIILNAYVIYVLGVMFFSLFISGKYTMSFVNDFVQLVRYIPIIVPLDYVWFRGFQISNMIQLLNHLYRKYGGVGCGLVRIRLLAMGLVIILIHTIRYVVYDKYQVAQKKTFLEAAENAFEFSLDVYLSFLLPLYCTFCYSIRFQFYIVKAFLYKLINERVRPNVEHLNKVKTLYTQASDQIMTTNSFFSLYLSVALLIMILGTVFDAGSMWEGLLKLAGGGFFAGIIGMIVAIGKDVGMEDDDSQGSGSGGEDVANSTKKFTPAEIREINFDIACVILTYLLIFYTVWQAVGTNDCVREIHVWLNDFVSGGGGTDVQGELESLGISSKGIPPGKNEQSLDQEKEEEITRGVISRKDFFLQEMPLVWGRNTLSDTGISDEFLFKFRNLKSFIHVRMQTEKPALLNISLLVLLAPPLSSRLRGYRIVF